MDHHHAREQFGMWNPQEDFFLFTSAMCSNFVPLSFNLMTKLASKPKLSQFNANIQALPIWVLSNFYFLFTKLIKQSNFQKIWSIRNYLHAMWIEISNGNVIFFIFVYLVFNGPNSCETQKSRDVLKHIEESEVDYKHWLINNRAIKDVTSIHEWYHVCFSMTKMHWGMKVPRSIH